MASNYPNPCDKCPRKSKCAEGCQEWIKRVRTIWKQFNGYPQRAAADAARQARQREAEEKRRATKLRYEHPDIVRRYLQNGPCEGCLCENTCDTPCAAYWHWWDARMQWIRGRLGV